jgi:phage/conjugal plasmid C-4 type zinc finger TraR family protein
MADDADRARQFEESVRRKGLAAATLPLKSEGRDFCLDCEGAISEARLNALPSAQRCIDCQTNFEGGR